MPNRTLRTSAPPGRCPRPEGIRFLFGCETEIDRHMRLAISRERFDEFDFVVIPTTHFHMEGLTRPAAISSPKQKAEFWMARLNALLDMDLPFHKIGVAHLTCSLIDRKREAWREILRLLDEDALRRVMARAAEKGVGIELNADDMRLFTEEEADLALSALPGGEGGGLQILLRKRRASSGRPRERAGGLRAGDRAARADRGRQVPHRRVAGGFRTKVGRESRDRSARAC